jgi:hypothetical protein
VLIAAIPAALVGLLSTHPQQQSLGLQYGSSVLALVYMAALFGLARVRRFIMARRLLFGHLRAANRFRVAAAAVLLFASATGAALAGPFPPEGGVQLQRFLDGGAAPALSRLSRLIPPDASLSAQSGLAAHLSQRRIQWEFPRLEGADYVIVQDSGNRSSQAGDGYEATRAQLPRLGYAEIAHDGGIHLYRRLPHSAAHP